MVFGVSMLDIDIGDIASDVWNGLSSIGSGISSAVKKALDLAHAVWDGLSKVATGIVSGFVSLGKYIYNGLADTLGRIKDGLVALAKAIWGGLVSAYDYLRKGLESVANGFKKVGEYLWNGLKEIAGKIWSGLVYVGNLIWRGLNWVYDKIKEVFSWILHKLSDILHAIIKTIMDAYNWIKSKLVAIGEDFGNYIGHGITFTAHKVFDNLPLLFAVNYGIDGATKGISDFMRGRIFDGLKSILLAPVGGYIAGTIIKSLVEPPNEMTLPFLYTGSVPHADVYESVNPSPVTTFTIESPLSLSGHVSVNVMAPLHIVIESPLVVGSGGNVYVSVVSPLYVSVESPLALGSEVQVSVVSPISIIVESPLALSGYVEVLVAPPIHVVAETPVDITPYVKVKIVSGSQYAYGGYSGQGSSGGGGGSGGGSNSGTVPPASSGQLGIKQGSDLIVSVDKLQYKPNEDIDIHATLTNGFLNSYDFYIRVFLCGGDDFSICNLVADKHIGMLSSMQSKSVDITVKAPANLGYYQYKVVAYLNAGGTLVKYDEADITIRVINPNLPTPV